MKQAEALLKHVLFISSSRVIKEPDNPLKPDLS